MENQMENQHNIVAENSPWVLLGSHNVLELEPKQLYISYPCISAFIPRIYFLQAEEH